MKPMNDNLKTLLLGQKPNHCGSGLKAMLNESGFTIMTAASGEEVVNICSENRQIGLILLSTDLPGLNCYDTSARIRISNPEIPIILLSNYVTVGSIRLALRMGCSQMIQNPINRSTLNAVLAKYSDENRYQVPTDTMHAAS
jgi:two-component system autoinducer 1 sensor kinase/phosphatase LuxN